MTLFHASSQTPRHGTSPLNRKLESLQLSLSLFPSFFFTYSYIRCRIFGHLAGCYVIHWPFLASLLQKAYRLTLSLSFSLLYDFSFVKSSLVQVCMSYLCIRFPINDLQYFRITHSPSTRFPLPQPYKPRCCCIS